ncbi:hypothetical protein ALC62_00567 [Cyphomyrmex costatus]|uniref:Uncharacterized protein n=1 Tax=Cyphomyrmex costatus TaxID=456900 RepID=A0A151IQM7_9HYME|nr:hypothetical protein ALC62_00567 [Cyphomyrmex costatus]
MAPPYSLLSPCGSAYSIESSNDLDNVLVNAAVNSLLNEAPLTLSSGATAPLDDFMSPDDGMDVDFTQVSRKRTRKRENNTNAKVKVVENLSDNQTNQPPSVSSAEQTTANAVNSPQPKQVAPHKTSHLYSETDTGPFAVYVYSDKSSVIHFSVLAKIVSEIARTDILSIKRLGSGKAIVEVRSALAANRLVINSAFAKYNIRVFIPAFKVLRTGIVRDVDQSLTIECIKDNIKSSAKILDIQRLNRRVTTEGQISYLPSRTR